MRGSLELAIGGGRISWRLFNKGATASRLERLELEWPEQLGGIENISLGEQTINPDLYTPAEVGSASIEIGATRGQATIPPGGTQDRLRFSGLGSA